MATSVQFCTAGNSCRRGVNGHEISIVPAGPDAASAAGSAGVGSGGSPGAPCERPGGRSGLERVLRAVPWGRSSQLAVRSADDGEGADLCVCDRHVLVAQDGEEAGGGHCVADAGGGELSEAPDAVRVPAPASRRLPGGVRGGGAPGPDAGSGGVGAGVGGRDEGSGEREQAQGDELRPDGQGGASVASGDRGVAGGGGSGRRGGGRPPRRAGRAGTSCRRS